MSNSARYGVPFDVFALGKIALYNAHRISRVWFNINVV